MAIIRIPRKRPSTLPGPKGWKGEIFRDDLGREPYMDFVESLTEFKAEALDRAITNVLLVSGLDLARESWLIPLKGGLYEFRLRHDAEEIAQMFGGERGTKGLAPEPVLLRVFVHFYGDKVVLLLAGYDKGKDAAKKRQDDEIKVARKLLNQFRERQKREKKRARG